MFPDRSAAGQGSKPLTRVGQGKPFHLWGTGARLYPLERGSEAGSYLRLTDSCITQLKAQKTASTCNESKEEEQRGQLEIRSTKPSSTNFEAKTLQGHRVHKKQRPPKGTAVGLCLWPYGGP